MPIDLRLRGKGEGGKRAGGWGEWGCVFAPYGNHSPFPPLLMGMFWRALEMRLWCHTLAQYCCVSKEEEKEKWSRRSGGGDGGRWEEEEEEEEGWRGELLSRHFFSPHCKLACRFLDGKHSGGNNEGPPEILEMWESRVLPGTGAVRVLVSFQLKRPRTKQLSLRKSPKRSKSLREREREREQMSSETTEAASNKVSTYSHPLRKNQRRCCQASHSAGDN